MGNKLGIKILITLLVFTLSGLVQVIAADGVTQRPIQAEEIYIHTLQETAAQESLSSKLTKEFQQLVGIAEGDLRTFVQTHTLEVEGKPYPVTTEYIQGTVTLDQLVEVLSVMQNDLLKIFLKNPKAKFEIKYLENNRSVSKEMPVSFFISLLRESNRINYEKIKLDETLREAISKDQIFRALINQTFDETKKRMADGSEAINYSPKTHSDKYSRISFSLIRFTGIEVIPYTLTYLVPPSLGIILTDVPDLNVFFTTQLLLGSASMAVQYFYKQFGNWIEHGWPNFANYKYGNSKALEYTRWWLLEGAFLALIPAIHVAMGVYPEISWIEYAVRTMFQTALMSTATQGLWDVIFINRYQRQLKNARNMDTIMNSAKRSALGTRLFNMTNVELAQELKANEYRVNSRFGRNLAINSIVSVSLATIQMVATSSGNTLLHTATMYGFGAYAIAGLTMIAKEKIAEARAQGIPVLNTIRPIQGLRNFFKNKEIVTLKKLRQEQITASTPRSCQLLFN